MNGANIDVKTDNSAIPATEVPTAPAVDLVVRQITNIVTKPFFIAIPKQARLLQTI